MRKRYRGEKINKTPTNHSSVRFLLVVWRDLFSYSSYMGSTPTFLSLCYFQRGISSTFLDSCNFIRVNSI